MIRLLTMLAQTPYQNRLRGLRGAFDERQSDPADVTGAIVLIGCLVAAALAWALFRHLSHRRKGDARGHNPLRMFDTLLRKLGISRGDRLLLRLFAKSMHVPHPAVILFDETFFDRQADWWLSSISFTPLRLRAKWSIEQLRARAFLTD